MINCLKNWSTVCRLLLEAIALGFSKCSDIYNPACSFQRLWKFCLWSVPRDTGFLSAQHEMPEWFLHLSHVDLISLHLSYYWEKSTGPLCEWLYALLRSSGHCHILPRSPNAKTGLWEPCEAECLVGPKKTCWWHCKWLLLRVRFRETFTFYVRIFENFQFFTINM